MQGIRNWLVERPLVLLAITVALYAVILSLPGLLSSSSFGRDIGRTAHQIDLGQLPLELLLAASIVVLVVYLGWRRETRLTTRPAWGGLWYLLPPLLIMAALLSVGIVHGITKNVDLNALFGARFYFGLLPMVLLVALFEELLFRGLVFRCVELKSGPVTALFVSSALFGLMHYVNWVTGQPFAITSTQVLHAGVAGILYGAIMLRTGSIWPSVLLHGFWDLVVALNGTLIGVRDPSDPATAGSHSWMATAFNLMIENFEAVFGLIILAIWWRWHRRR